MPSGQLRNKPPRSGRTQKTDFGALLESLNIPNYAEPTALLAHGEIGMPLEEQYSRPFNAKADRHALKFYSNIPDITPVHMADPQMLAWLSCFHLLEFGISPMAPAKVYQLDQTHSGPLLTREWTTHHGRQRGWKNPVGCGDRQTRRSQWKIIHPRAGIRALLKQPRGLSQLHGVLRNAVPHHLG